MQKYGDAFSKSSSIYIHIDLALFLHISAYLDEQCEIASGCQVTINSGEQSSVRPTCQSGVCNCSAGSSQFDRLIGTCSKLCLSKLNRTYHDCEGGIEKSVSRITDWHHIAYLVNVLL